MPPNIAYLLTPMGTTLWAATAPLITWATARRPDIDAARHRYDGEHRVEEHDAQEPGH